MGADIVGFGALAAAIILTIALARLALAVAAYFDRHNGK
jgi:hypothetical protein